MTTSSRSILMGLLLCGAISARALAHPMGNFSISHYAQLRPHADELRLDYRLDIAELPSVEEMRLLDADRNQTVTQAENDAYLAAKGPALCSGLMLKINGRAVPLSIVRSSLLRRAGAADLPTILIMIECRAPLVRGEGPIEIEYRDDNYQGRAGWKEIVTSAGSGWRVVRSNVAPADLSQGLLNYPADGIAAPPQVLAASVAFASDDSTAAAPPNQHPNEPPAASGSTSPRDRFTQLISAERITWGFMLVALGVAFAMGAAHALAPGHGKTVVGAYLVGSRGTARHAVLLGVVVTLTHVAGVFLLGVAVLLLSKHVVPDQFYPWLGFASGMLITIVGAQQFVERYTAWKASAADEGHTHEMPDKITLGSLIAMGVSGGMVPCPSALVVLLGSIALGRVGIGLLLIVAFSVGLAMVLIATGLLMLYAGHLLDRLRKPDESGRRGRWHALPLVSSMAVALLGLGIAFQSLYATGAVR